MDSNQKATKKDLKLPIYFYVVYRKHQELANGKHTYVHLNYVEQPGFVAMGHNMFSSYAHYKSLDKQTTFNDAYTKALEPIINEMIGEI